MTGKIFYRERTKQAEGEKKPRFNLVAVAGVNLKVFAKHIRKSELEQIAKAVEAELVLLERKTGPHGADEDEVEIER